MPPKEIKEFDKQSASYASNSNDDALRHQLYRPEDHQSDTPDAELQRLARTNNRLLGYMDGSNRLGMHEASLPVLDDFLATLRDAETPEVNHFKEEKQSDDASSMSDEQIARPVKRRIRAARPKVQIFDDRYQNLFRPQEPSVSGDSIPGQSRQDVSSFSLVKEKELPALPPNLGETSTSSEVTDRIESSSLKTKKRSFEDHSRTHKADSSSGEETDRVGDTIRKNKRSKERGAFRALRERLTQAKGPTRETGKSRDLNERGPSARELGRGAKAIEQMLERDRASGKILGDDILIQRDKGTYVEYDLKDGTTHPISKDRSDKFNQFIQNNRNKSVEQSHDAQGSADDQENRVTYW